MNQNPAPAAVPDRYDKATIRYHWITALLVVMLWIVGQTIDDFARGMPRTSVRSGHIAGGVLLAVILVARIWWRVRSGTRVAPANQGLADVAARAVHGLLYVLLILTVCLGISNAWIRGDTIVFLGKIPSLAPGNKELKEAVENLHGLAANATLVLAGLHALAGLVHQFVLRDGLLYRMLPARRTR